MELSIKQNLYKFSAVHLFTWAVYLLALFGWLQFSEAYFSASSPGWKHYLLGIFLIIGPFITYFSIKQIRANKKVNYLYAFSPLIWVILILVLVWLFEVFS
jgi:hypothetical protein